MNGQLPDRPGPVPGRYLVLVKVMKGPGEVISLHLLYSWEHKVWKDKRIVKVEKEDKAMEDHRIMYTEKEDKARELCRKKEEKARELCRQRRKTKVVNYVDRRRRKLGNYVDREGKQR